VKPWIGPACGRETATSRCSSPAAGASRRRSPEDRVDSVIEAPRGRHSEKPARFYELIERMYPQASKLELFARVSRPGWVGWGNEVPA
jgi:N6-adenosine-specific RNA methylase IME4